MRHRSTLKDLIIQILFASILLAFIGNLILLQVHVMFKKHRTSPLRYQIVLKHEDNISQQQAARHEINLTDKTDWNNYTLMSTDLMRTGPGEQGKSVILSLYSKDEITLSESLYQTHKFNVTVSSQISWHRSIGDQRDKLCKNALFIQDIPENSVSIIIPFYNEHNSTILRTIYSIMARTPEKLLREIILVDDKSTLPELQNHLDEFVVSKNLNKVKILRNEKRMGLILSRIAGADASSGRFLVILDSHIEVNYNYLPPLIEPILADYKTISCPVIDVINKHDFRVSRIDYERNAFQWNLQNEHFAIFQNNSLNLPSPFPTPVMMGGAFAIDRKWWEKIGKYDPGLDVWGGEQYEISFKTWMCGGKILNVPCSRIAHLFRNQLPYSVGDVYFKNIKRVAFVWMDEYQHYVYKRLPGVEKATPGDLSSQLKLRQTLHCRSFKWYMNTIAPDILYNWPVVEPTLLAWGPIRPTLRHNYCLKFSTIDKKHDTIFLDKCRNNPAYQKFEYSWRRTIKESNGIRCFETNKNYSNVLFIHHFRLNATKQHFVWDRLSGWIVSLTTGHCLHYKHEGLSLDMRPCQRSNSFSWSFENYYSSAVDEEWNKFKRLGQYNLNEKRNDDGGG